jgi:hypothetical protein
MKKMNLIAARMGRLASVAAMLASVFVTPMSAQKAAQKGAPRPSAIVFAVATGGGEMTIDPILGLGAGGRVLPAGNAEEDELKRFAADYFKAGRKYRLISGGGDAGTVVVKESKIGSDCFRTGASVEPQVAGRLGGNVMGLATDSQTLGRRAPVRRAPTDEERAGVEKLARTLLAQKRLSDAQLRNLKTINLTALDFNNDGAVELVGTFKVARGKGAADLLFLLAEPGAAAGADYRAGLSNHVALKAADLLAPEVFETVGPGGFFSEILIDQLDIDGDGTGELFTYGQSLEGAQYKVYKKTRGRWLKLQEFSVYRCAY